MTNGSLMKVESIAAFCNSFDLHEGIIGLENQFLVFLRGAVLHRFYCTYYGGYISGCPLSISGHNSVCIVASIAPWTTMHSPISESDSSSFL